MLIPAWPFPVAACTVAAALLCWPGSGAVHRLRIGDRGAVGDRNDRLRAARTLVVPAATVGGWLLAGVGGACAAAMVAVLGRRYWRSRAEARSRLDGSTALAAAIRLLVAELRVGAHPATAAEGAATDAASSVATVFADISAAARLGGDVPGLLLAGDRTPPALRAPTGRLARCWRLAERHGVALADLLDAVRRDLDHRNAFVRDVEAKMAGPRSTAAVLAGLPVLGLLLGEAVGAEPIAVLTTGLLGQSLLVAGTGLLCAGMSWTARLTESVVRP